MPLPVAHSVIGASVAAVLHRKSEDWWKLLCLSAFLGVCPDFDYILNWLRVGRGGWHHGFTHSIVFALVVGALTSLAAGGRSSRGRGDGGTRRRGDTDCETRSVHPIAASPRLPVFAYFITFSAATASHTLLDYVMTESRGVSLWWPFTDRRYKLRGPNPIDYTWSTASFSDAAVDILRICLTELIIFGPILLIVLLLRSRNAGTVGASKGD